MKTTMTRRGTLLGVCWMGVLCAAVGIAVWLLFTARWGFFVFCLLFVLSTVACWLHRIHYTVEVSERECVLRRGLFLHSVVKIPVRYVTATTCFSSPLSRRLGVGVLLIASSGRLTALIGLSLADIAVLRELLSERQV